MEGYVRTPYKFINANSVAKLTNGERRFFSPVQVDILSLIFSYSSNGRNRCYRSFSALAEKFNVARSTIARAIAELKTLGLIDQKKGKISASYTIAEGVADGRNGAIRTDDWLFYHEFTFKDGTVRTLSAPERRILGKMVYECEQRKNAYDVSISELCGKLNLSKHTVSRALRSLYDCGLVFRKSRGTSRFDPSVYTISFTNLKKRFDEAKKAQRNADPVAPTSTDRADRERFYEERQRKAYVKAEQLKAVAYKDAPDLIDLEKEISRNNIDLAKARAFGKDQEAKDLETKGEKLHASRQVILARIGLTEEDLEVKHYCTKCHDEGFLPNGRACDCYDCR